MIHTIARYYNTLGAQGSLMGSGGPTKMVGDQRIMMPFENQIIDIWPAGKTWKHMIKRIMEVFLIHNMESICYHFFLHHFLPLSFGSFPSNCPLEFYVSLSKGISGVSRNSQVGEDYQSLLQDHQPDDPQLQGTFWDGMGWRQDETGGKSAVP